MEPESLPNATRDDSDEDAYTHAMSVVFGILRKNSLLSEDAILGLEEYAENVHEHPDWPDGHDYEGD